MFSLEFSRRANKTLAKLPPTVSRRIVTALEELCGDPFPRDSIRIKGESSVFRIRVGDYRILYEVYHDRHAILIVDVDHRSRVYGRW